MDDCRLVAARQMLWEPEIWREPARVGLIIRALDEIVGNEAETAEAQVEATMLIRKLRVASKTPPPY
jgi:hypothetical protein